MKIYYDDTCRFCTRWAQRTGEKICPLSKSCYKGSQSMVIEHNGKVFTKSDAVILLYTHKGGLGKLFIIAKVFPKAVRDKLYDWFGKVRHLLN